MTRTVWVKFNEKPLCPEMMPATTLSKFVIDGLILNSRRLSRRFEAGGQIAATPAFLLPEIYPVGVRADVAQARLFPSL